MPGVAFHRSKNCSPFMAFPSTRRLRIFPSRGDDPHRLATRTPARRAVMMICAK
jgi:hypothetical protein